ncbi:MULTISPECIES: superinfection immunity protein [unclassified Myroides]|uniref:superinfection immunity protein n=1 Tax=unclassified Myroides TaxID=2642485 RepID=UPI003D2F534A
MEIILIILMLGAYFLPSILGYSKGNFVAIFALNLLLGWTLIGWVIALVWSLSEDRQNTVIVQSNETKSVAAEIAQLKELLDKGILSETEFETQKTKLLNR